MPDRKNIQRFIHSTLARSRFVAVSNREPYVHSYDEDGRIQCSKPTSGMVSALDPVLKAGNGIWIAHGSGNADDAVVDAAGCVAVPPDDPRYLLKRVWLTADQQEGYYQGFSNQALWPLCHHSYVRPVFDRTHWKTYQKVNELFADHVWEAVGDAKALVFVQDYHFALLPRLIKQRCPRAVVAHFWHIPWPAPEVLRICPWQREGDRQGDAGQRSARFSFAAVLPEFCRRRAGLVPASREAQARRGSMRRKDHESPPVPHQH